MPESPFLSVITVSYNAEKTIADTLNSLKNQSSNDFESIVIDGGSTDGTVDMVKSFGGLVGKLISEPDQGIYDAMNKGIQLASGTYLAFLNSDDAYFPETIEKVKAFALKFKPSVIYGNMLKERQLGREVLSRLEKPKLELMPQTMGIFHPASFVKRELFDHVGGFDLRFRHAADYHWFLKVYMQEVDFAYLDAPLARFRLGGVSNFSCEAYREAVIIQEELKTGHHEEMKKLLQACLNKQERNKWIARFSKWPILRDIYREKIKKRWK
jgi:glycosyltransferase involved in cell wall biosynthesis